ncbi:hypothetical protein ACFXHK_07230 [Embleya sp. NPDC059267]|uniref:helix-hairpin-helix domain-containing protein n=1 Tax=Embleya sp. NPDC059267 TaxID=3346798 RepID=UPI00369BCEE8
MPGGADWRVRERADRGRRTPSGVPILPVDVNHSHPGHTLERTTSGTWGVRAALSAVRGITDQECACIAAGRPYTLPDGPVATGRPDAAHCRTPRPHRRPRRPPRRAPDPAGPAPVARRIRCGGACARWAEVFDDGPGLSTCRWRCSWPWCSAGRRT